MKRLRVVIDENHQFVREYDVEDNFPEGDDDAIEELVDADEQLTDGFTDVTERLVMCTNSTPVKGKNR